MCIRDRIKDEGSLNGTYIKSNGVKLQNGTLIELGNILYRCTIDEKAKSLEMKAVAKKLLEQREVKDIEISFTQKNTFTIGRKFGGCDYTIDDPEVALNHIKIVWASTHTPHFTAVTGQHFWIRLSESKKLSQPYQILVSNLSEEKEIRLGKVSLKLSFKGKDL
eukprot:TRINITY_DN4866_c0_g1_i2.p1 TRINITY_DN4866_c0_g1~~TRINITY_DN4866_c0_g1_i2.p1  ORF type:complete len:164 (+),score=17.88 TRINITY_DN4866_c0_g1_i2:64-555(+)